MAMIDVNIIDPTGARDQPVQLPDDQPIRRIIDKLVEMMEMPAHGPDGAPLSYRFHHKRSGRQLGDNDTLKGAGVIDRDILRLQPEIVAGSQ